MKLSGAIQEALLSLVCYGEVEQAGVVTGLVHPAIYDPYYREIAEATYQYFEAYHRVSQEHTLDIFDALKLREPDRAEIYEQLFLSIASTVAGVNAEYVLDQAQLFVRGQRLKQGITKAIQLLEQDDSQIDEADAALEEARKHTSDLFYAGIHLQDPAQSLSFLSRDDRDQFYTGILALDSRGLGPSRKEMHVFVAPSGRGKTWWLTALGRNALMHGRSVLHVTLEMSEDKLAQRYLQSFFGVTKRKGQTQHWKFNNDENWRSQKFDELIPVDARTRPSLEDSNIVPYLIKKIEKVIKRKPPLIIRQFPTGSLTVRELEAYLDALEVHKKFIPDLLIIDYPDLMAIDQQNYRIGVRSVYEQLRGLAIKRNLALATVSQTNRAGATAKNVTEAHLSEDYSKMMTADVLITYNQTDEEKHFNLARLFVQKGRNDEDKFSVIISQNYATGQFATYSARMVKQYMAAVEAEAAGLRNEEED